MAAGQSTRFGKSEPKQFMNLLGKPVFEWSLNTFHSLDEITSIILLVPKNYLNFCEKLIYPKYSKVTDILEGGETRFQSVLNGLKKIKNKNSYVLIHDAARPGITAEIIQNVIQTVKEKKVVLPLLAVSDTLKQVEGECVQGTIPRINIKMAQTPQAFYLPLLWECIEKMSEDDVWITDEIQLIEKYSSYPISYVTGSIRNLKITTSEDFEQVQSFLSNQLKVSYRTGIGYDIHPFRENRKFILGGVEIPYELGLQGHSDADVLSHAIADALLGAAALGDIGMHFPDTDDTYRNVSSILLLSKVNQLMKENGYEIVNIDATLILESPKISNYRKQMIDKLSGALSISPSFISIKATTNEALGAIGRKEGVAAFAIATLRHYD